jgi:hypothetical protein
MTQLVWTRPAWVNVLSTAGPARMTAKIFLPTGGLWIQNTSACLYLRLAILGNIDVIEGFSTCFSLPSTPISDLKTESVQMRSKTHL